MKKLSTAIISLSLMALVSGAAYAEGSKIEGSTILNGSVNSKALNMAIGRDSTANTGSINIESSEVKGSKILNFSKNDKTLNMAIGRGSRANTGSIDIH